MNYSEKSLPVQNMTRVVIVTESSVHARLWREWIDSVAQFRCVRTCLSGKQALNEVPKLSADVALIDTDAENSGIPCAGKLKEICPGIHIIMLSSSQEHDTVFGAFQAGASGFLLKTASSEQVLWAISEVQAGGAPMSREVARQLIQRLRRPSSGAPLKLSPRELDVLALLSKAKSTKQIASDLGISYQTACVHLRRIYEKLGVRCRTEAVIKYLQSQGEMLAPAALWQEEASNAEKALVSA